MTPRCRPRLLPMLLACLFASHLVRAADWLPLSDEELKMTSDPHVPKAAAIYLYRQVDRNDRLGIERRYARLKVLTDEGRQRANVSIAFDKNRQTVGSIEARTIHPDGSIVKFDGTVYEKPLLEGSGNRMVTKTFTLPSVETGSIIEYRFEIHFMQGRIFDSSWILSADLYTKSANFSLVPYDYLALQASAPAGLPGGAVLPKLTHNVFRFSVHDVPEFVTEQFMLPAEELQMRVDFVYYPNKLFDKDPVAFWKNFDKLAYESTHRFQGTSDPMEQALAQIVAPGDSPEQKLRKIYARSQSIRNLSFERARSEQEVKRESAQDNRDAADVWKHQYGDAWQITQLFAALARAAHLDADIVYASTRNRFLFSLNSMNTSQLDVAMAVVHLDGRDLYLSPGTPVAPFGALPWPQTAVPGLRLDPQGGSWITTPMPAASESRSERAANLDLAPDGTLKGSVTCTFTGLEALFHLLQAYGEDETGKKRLLEDALKRAIASPSTVTLTDAPDWTGASPTLVAKFDIEVPGWATVAGRRILMPLGLFGGNIRHTFEHGARVHSVYFHYVFQVNDDIVIRPPAGFQAATLPEPSGKNITVANFQERIENAGSTVRVVREFSIGTLLVKAQFYGDIQEFYRAARTGDEEQAVFLPASTPTQH